VRKNILLLIAVFLVLLGLTGVLWPSGLVDLAKWTFAAKGLYVAAALRMIIGALLLILAGGTATPKAVRVIGAVIFIAGVATALLSAEMAQRLAAWWLEHGEDRLRITACLPLAMGIFLAFVTLFRKA
jgi:hypothetical protein